MIIKFSKKIVRKEWHNLLLPFFSILLTGAVITTSFLLISSARDFISSKNKEFLGGDVSYSSSNDFDVTKLLDPQKFKYSYVDISEQITFSGLVQSDENSSSANFQIIDNYYPLYGKVVLKNGEFEKLKPNEVYIDENLYKNIGGDTLSFNNTDYVIKGIIVSSPESLLGGFSFTGSLLMSQEGLLLSGADLNFFRKEFVTKVRLSDKLEKSDIEALRAVAQENNVRARFDGSGQGGLSFGLDIVERFLIISILIISILSLVNVYSSINYLSGRLRRSFAILIALGLDINSVYKILFLVSSFVIFLGTTLGIGVGYFTTKTVEDLVERFFSLDFSLAVNYLDLLYILLIVFITSIFATLPVISRLRGLTPRELLSHTEKKDSKRTSKNILFDVISGILPISLVAIYLLDSFLYGIISMAVILFLYGGLMLLYYYFIEAIYRARDKFPFSLKLITSQKKFDGFFGLITFASLFIALVAVFNLSILRTSIKNYLTQDLIDSVPSTYVLDVQNSQKENLVSNFPELTLFPNVRARIVSIDNLDIQTELVKDEPKIDRELGREFNLTYRDYLLPSEKTTSGNFGGINTGEVSLESDFAERANIKMGSEIVFLIQGFEIKTKVTSIREVDTRSGYPFFYFILSPTELSEFPKTFFGYASIDSVRQDNLRNYLADNTPNVSVIDTSSITKIGEDLINILLLIILIITIPPIVLSSMLIVTILASLSKDRKRDGARLMAIGKENKYVRNFYIFESTSTVILASVFAYIFSVILSNFIVIKYLEINSTVYFDFISLSIFAFILFGIVCVSVFLWKKDGKSLREYLNYEENN